MTRWTWLAMIAYPTDEAPCTLCGVSRPTRFHGARPWHLQCLLGFPPIPRMLRLQLALSLACLALSIVAIVLSS